MYHKTDLLSPLHSLLRFKDSWFLLLSLPLIWKGQSSGRLERHISSTQEGLGTSGKRPGLPSGPTTPSMPQTCLTWRAVYPHTPHKRWLLQHNVQMHTALLKPVRPVPKRHPSPVSLTSSPNKHLFLPHPRVPVLLLNSGHLSDSPSTVWAWSLLQPHLICFCLTNT